MSSAYFRKQKQPYSYVFPRCSHKETHVESYNHVDSNKVAIIAKVRVCNVCNTMQGQAFKVQTRILTQRRSNNEA